ncbi:MAG: hypothetical protein NTX26_00700 [Candidatus Parcubacteria bacterium]|nr:hypothetical protein [Candidatus Parcubacteria bacterium]
MEVQEKELKDILEGQRKEYQKYLGVLTENFDPQLRLVVDSLTGVQEQLVALREMVAKNTEDIEIMRMDLHIIKDDLTEKISRADFKIIEKRIDLLEKRLQKA